MTRSMVLTFSHPTVILEEKIYTMNNTQMKTKVLTFRELTCHS